MTTSANERSGFAARSVPAELKARWQWVGFKIIPNTGGKPKKIPVRADSPDRQAKSTYPSTWDTFDTAAQGLADGAYGAVGYALAGDIVGIDLDGERWVAGDGALSQEAQAMVERCGSYAELSISGKGVHILLHGKLPGERGRRNKAAAVEIYIGRRFFIVTGQQLDGTPREIMENQAAGNSILDEFFSERGPTEKAEKTEIMASVSSESSGNSAFSAYSVGSPLSVEDVIRRTLPRKQGQRNDCILSLARGLKFDAGMGDAGFAQLKPIVRQWHTLALGVIGTEDFDETWSDFVRAFGSAKCPLRWKAGAWALARAKANPPPPAAAAYDSEPVRPLVGICWHLASLHHQQRFFLSSHEAGAMLGVNHDKALRWLQMLYADEVLRVVERGNEHRATRYRYVHEDATEKKT